jgi:GDP-L-fucose synthase
MNKNSKIYLAGHRGLVGSALKNNLVAKGYKNIITRTHKELDLSNQFAVAEFFKVEKPEYVLLAAAKVGGIVANNTYRADFIYENLMIQNNVIHQSFVHGVKKLLFLGSTCIYPKNCPQPMKEEYLLTDTLEYTNEPYAIAKIAGIKMCESYNLQYDTNYIAVQPTNLYGPNDNFDLEKSHVLPALIRKIHLGKALENNDWEILKKDLNHLPIEGVSGKSSKEEIEKILSKYGVRYSDQNQSKSEKLVEVEIWGSGKPLREFLWSEDMADACIHVMENVDFKELAVSKAEAGKSVEVRNTHINIGTGKEISIKELAETIKKAVGFQGSLYFNADKPDGTLRKLTDSSKLEKLGWKYKVELTQGIQQMYAWYCNTK